MNQKRKVFVINPGSTSTKIAIFEENEKLFELNVAHDDETIQKSVPEQLPLRMAVIENAVKEAGYSLADMTAFSGRGGGCVNCAGGVYEVNDVLLADARAGRGAMHPATLGSQIADALAKRYGGRAFIVNPPDVDEYALVSRVTGMKNIFRTSNIHTLNHKEVAARYAEQCGKLYNELNLIIAHMGGGISVAAHQAGVMIDSSNNIKGEGPMAPTRCGTLPAVQLIRECFSGAYTEKEMVDRISKKGGWLEHLGTADGREVVRRIEAGDAYAKLIYEATALQVAKAIGAMAAVLGGKTDAIILSGGLAHDGEFIRQIRERVAFIAPVTVYPGEFELEALCAGVLRALDGKEPIKEYIGIPVWTPESMQQ